MDVRSDTNNFFVESIYNPTTPADDDVFALYQWNFKNSIGTTEPHAEMKMTCTDVTDGTEDSDIDFSVFDAGTFINILRLDGSGNRLYMPSGARIDLNGGALDDIGSFSMNSLPSITGSRGGNAGLASLLSAYDGQLWTCISLATNI